MFLFRVLTNVRTVFPLWWVLLRAPLVYPRAGTLNVPARGHAVLSYENTVLATSRKH